jgi:hypothetical protein
MLPPKVLNSGEYLSYKVSEWIVTESDINEDIKVIYFPESNCIPNECLSPAIHSKIYPIESVDDLANLLNAPGNWKELATAFISDESIQSMFSYLEEPQLTRLFLCDMAMKILHFLGKFDDENKMLVAMYHRKMIVGGILADPIYDVRSTADLAIGYFQGPCYLSAVISHQQPNQPFPQDLTSAWGNEIRGVQLISMLYGLNNCPVFLMNNKEWRLFVEKPGRDGILVYGGTKYDDDEFIKVLTICLSRNIDDELDLKQPKFITGYSLEGIPVYSQVRVYSR